MKEVNLKEAEKEAQQAFPNSTDAGQIADLFYGNFMVIHTTTGHRIVITKEDHIKRLMTACAVLLGKVEALKDI